MQPLPDSVLETSQRKAMEEHPVPAFGRTRCYWSLLDADLRYLYLDPTCSAHMGKEASNLIGSCLLDYVHPDEQHSARADLGNVLDSRTLHGSVTRVRYARLSRIRAILGCDTPETFPDAHMVTEDEHYIACDVVINWVSDNVVLCFLHAIIDKGKADNDELNKTQWTNWCGTSAMTTDHAAELYARLQERAPPSHSPPDRIFQILINQPARPILFSWPPEGYTAGEFGKLAHRMQIGSGGDNHSRNEDSAKTSCTRRYKATQPVADGATLKEVESIFIPHGAVIFACHKVMSNRAYSNGQNRRSSAPDMYQHPYPQQQHYPLSAQGHYENERRDIADADYTQSGVPSSPEYARARVPTSGYQRGPTEYPQYGAHAGPREMEYGGTYHQPYDSGYPMQRNGTYPPVQQHSDEPRNTHDREEWGYAQPQPSSQPAPGQQWPATKSTTPNPNGPGYEGQPWVMSQAWNQGPVEQARGQQQLGYSYPTSQQYGAPQLPPPQQPQPLSPPPPYAQDVPVTQPPPHPEPVSQPKRDESPQEGAAIPRAHAPPKRKRESEPKKEKTDKAHDDDALARLSPSSKDVIARERGQSTGAASSRVGGGPPPGVMRCSSCKSETSPEWRKGPSGKKDLCNACGLRYARSKQKKDGFGQTKRRRDKDIPLAPAPTPPSAPRHTASLPSNPSNASSSGTTWPSVVTDGRNTKRVRSDTFTSTSHSPSPPRSEAPSQQEHYPDTYDSRYGQTVYQNGYPNGYDMEYGRMQGSAAYGPPQLPQDGRGQAPAFAGQ